MYVWLTSLTPFPFAFSFLTQYEVKLFKGNLFHFDFFLSLPKFAFSIFVFV